MKKCPNCSEELPDSAKYCFACGVILDSQTIKCPECSTENPKDAIACERCGHTLSQERQTAREPLVQWRFVNLLGKYVYVTCDNCRKEFKINRERCIEENDGFSLKAPEKCPSCGLFAREIYFAGTEPMFRNYLRKIRLENRGYRNRVNIFLILLNVIFLIIIASLGVRGWIRGDFQPKPTRTLIPSRTPRPSPTRPPLVYERDLPQYMEVPPIRLDQDMVLDVGDFGFFHL